MVDADDVLVDDRSVVELLGDVMGRRPDQLDAPLARPPIGIGAGERRQERVVDVDRRHPHARQEVAAQYLHVARQHEQLGIALQKREHRRLGPLLADLLHRHVVERHARRDGLVLELAMVGDHRHDLPVQLAASSAPEQVEQAMVVA